MNECKTCPEVVEMCAHFDGRSLVMMPHLTGTPFYIVNLENAPTATFEAAPQFDNPPRLPWIYWADRGPYDGD